ncbi:MAG: hypothetical protein JSU79_04920 [Dehalococcoidales bacterium]|nr:MAG: hypothetical protein JSU79_04920 [Dehalococcoidales bacterium]
MTTTGLKDTKNDGYILDLNEIVAETKDLVGIKAANLGELSQNGFRVPDGFVITTHAFEEFLEDTGINGDSSPEDIIKATVPLEVNKVISSAVTALGDVEVAVRSSGTAEDLPGASFAGQYETFLSIRGEKAVIDAVRRCWASAFSERVSAYRKSTGQESISGMAVLVQKMVNADVAGVTFSANPVTGNRDEVIVSAVKGLGERLVSGEASPDEWLVNGSKTTCQRAPESAVNADQVKSVAELAQRVERHFGTPQDIEWALTDGELFLLQARPITSLPQPPVLPDFGEGSWMKDTAHCASPVTPFGASVHLPAVDYGAAVAFREFGLPIDGSEQKVIGGEIYMRTIPLGGKEPSGPTPPSWILSLLIRLIPTMRRRYRIAQHALQTNLMDRVIDRWDNEWRDEFRQKARNFLAVDLKNVDNETLLNHLDETIDFLRYGEAVHFRLMLPYVLRNYELAKTCEELLGWDTTQAMSLLSGTSKISSEPGRRLAELAFLADQNPRVKEIISEGNNVLLRLRKVEPKFAYAFDEYLGEYGHRTTNYEPGSPTLAEKPELLVNMIRDRLNSVAQFDVSDPDEIREDAEKRARSELVSKSQEDCERFEETLKAAQRTNPIREDNVFYTDNVPSAIIRYAVLEIGHRLVDCGIITDYLDVFYLTNAEVRSALRGEHQDYRALIVRRKGEQAWVAAHPGPSSYGKEPGPPPDPNTMPEPWRTWIKAELWYMNVAFETPSYTSTDNEFRGVPGSPGHYTGTVRVIRDESQFARLMPGDILVCPITTPSWSILFIQAGAVITDGGGVLSHAAIVARENGIPAVLGTLNATQSLIDGQTVTVDGTRGLVLLGSHEESS